MHDTNIVIASAHKALTGLGSLIEFFPFCAYFIYGMQHYQKYSTAYDIQYSTYLQTFLVLDSKEQRCK
jgi:hypothetical protein